MLRLNGAIAVKLGLLPLGFGARLLHGLGS
jgi:hypothetical protein